MTNNIETYLTNQVNNQSLIPSTDVILLTLTPKMTTTQVVETSVAVNNNSPIQDLSRTITLRLLMRWLLSSNHAFTKLDLLTPKIFVCFPSWFIPTLYYCCTSAQVKGVKAPTLVWKNRPRRPKVELKLANDNLYLNENDNTISEIVRMWCENVRMESFLHTSINNTAYKAWM